MADREQLYTALRNADAAGDVEGARKLASYIQSLPADSKAAVKAPDPTDGMSTFDKAAAGVGKSVVDTYEGLKQFGAGIGNKVGLVDDKTVANLQAQADERARLDKPLMDTGAGMAGNIGGQVLQMAVPGMGLGKIGTIANATSKTAQAVKAAAGGGAFALTQPVLSNESRTGNALMGAAGGAVGQGLVTGVNALAAPAKAALSPAIQALAAKAEQLGIPVNAAQLSDSKFVQTLASTLEKMPFTGARESRNAQQGAFNQAVSKTFGEDAPAITNDVYAGAKKRIGQEFDRLSAQNTLKLDDGVLGALSKVETESSKFATSDTEKAVKSSIEELLSKADKQGNVPGAAYQALDSKLTRLMKSGGEKANYLGDLREAVRNAMDNSISPADQEAWQTARAQYRNLKSIRDLVAKDGANGDISPAALMGRMTNNEAGKESMAMGRGGDLADIARIGRQFVRDKIPDSGTAQRMAALSLLGGGSYLAGVDPKTALLTAASGATLGRGLNKLMNSQTAREYMLNGSGAAARIGNALSPLPYVTAPLALELKR